MEFEQILKLVDHVSASHLESFCYESDGVKLTLNNKIAPVIIPGTCLLYTSPPQAFRFSWMSGIKKAD